MLIMSKVRARMGSALSLAVAPFQPRQGSRVFGVGAAKTGTHSLAAMFADRVAAGHEVDDRRLIRLHLDRVKRGSDTALRQALRVRDLVRNLKVDASQVNVYLVRELAELFPDARFVLTVRPPMSWLRSMIDDSLRREVDPIWMRFRVYRFQHPISTLEPFSEAERALAEKGLFRLDGYLHYWRDSIERVMGTLPPERLMIVRTEDLSARSAEIAAFCGIPGGAAGADRTHAFINPTRFGLLAQVPEDHLRTVAERQCGDLFRKIFPERDLVADINAVRHLDAVPFRT